MRWAGRGAAVALGLAVLSGAWEAQPAFAHAGLETTSPSASAVLEEPPTEIVLDFDEPVERELAQVQLLFQDGTEVSLERPVSTGDSTQVVSPVSSPDDMALGVYVVIYHVTSADSHAVSGSFSFQLGTGAADQASILASLTADEGGSDGAVAAALWSARLLAYAGTVALLGGWMLVALAGGGAPGRRTRVLLWCGLGVAFIGTLGTFVLQGPNVLGTGFSGIFDNWSEVAGTRYGRSLLARMFFLLLAALPTIAIAITRTAQWRFAAAAVGLSTLVTFGIGLHPGSGRWPVLGVTLDVVHMGAAALWLGGLFLLAVSGREWLHGTPTGTPAAVAVGRFSTMAVICVPIVVVTGLLQSWRLLESFDAISSTPWGHALVAKVSVAIVLMVLGGMARHTLRRFGPSSLRATVMVEAAIGLAVLGLTASLVARTPDLEHGVTPTVVTLAEGDVSATLTVTPAHVGANEFHLVVVLPATATEPSQTATIRMSLPERGIQGLNVAMAPDGPDHYVSYGVQLPFAGDWEMQLLVETTADETVSMNGSVAISSH